MLNSPILEVAIGMILFYLLLSLICSTVNELIEAWWKNRARDLESGIRRMLDDELDNPSSFIRHLGEKILRFFKILFGAKLKPPLTSTSGLAGRIYDHALIRGLYLDKRELPSYIPARNFALALMDLVAAGGAKGATGVPLDPGKAAALDVLRQGLADEKRVPSSRVRDALIALIDAAGDDPVVVRQNIENWYNSSMDRVAGWYKRRTQVIILAIGFGVALATNADTVLVVNALWQSSDLRSGMMKEAEQLTQDHNLPAAPKQTLASLSLPIGWDNQDVAHTLPLWSWGQTGPFLSASVHQLYLHWLGWLLTGIAISLGAPFWFDLLNKFMVVRSTIKPQEKSPNEPSKN